ncbi:hypothetical protein [Thiogranum longum]
MLGRLFITFFAVLLGLFVYKVFEPAIFGPMVKAAHEKIYGGDKPQRWEEMISAYVAGQFMNGRLVNCFPASLEGLDEHVKPKWTARCAFHATFYVNGNAIETLQTGRPVYGTFYFNNQRVTGYEMVTDVRALR